MHSNQYVQIKGYKQAKKEISADFFIYVESVDGMERT